MTAHIKYTGNLKTLSVHHKSGAEMKTDAPVDNHGTGSGFSPTDTTATSLGTCMITVMGIKALEQGISFHKISANITKLMTGNPRRIKEIQVDLEIGEQWSEKEKAIMEYTALNCPVALSLHPDIKQNVRFIYAVS